MQAARDHQEKPRRRPGISEGTVRVGPLAGIVPVTHELGVNPEEILENFGFTTAQFEDPDFEIPYVAAGRLLARCTKATRCPQFGLLVGMRATPSTLGIPGFLLQNAPDVRTALDALVQNLDLHDQGGVPFLDMQGKSIRLGYVIYQAQVDASDQIYDLAIAIGCNIMRCLCGVGWNPSEVCLSRTSPPDLEPYRRFYRAPVRFNMDRNTLEFPIRWMNHKIPSADALLLRHLEREANELHTRRQANIISDARRLLHTSLMNGQCTANEIAKQLCIHERTLHRRFHEEGTSFQQELDAVRGETARQLLTCSDMPIVRIAATLNYSSVSAFNRAFKRWTGFTPARWRTINTASFQGPSTVSRSSRRP